ncbi:hypothetical protein KEH51_18060 [[Brevibacterium] frigoritolerans]|uniref:Uncharacterized protein n=1 Tax=Peribacillus frigoritolerans TaxID=450367 RepID=A0A941FJV1_9BACI|nr:hypothetical protein [Peribacillus frigoritolerans]
MENWQGFKNWRQNKQELSQKAKYKESESGRYEAVTFHYAEVHQVTPFSPVPSSSVKINSIQ